MHEYLQKHLTQLTFCANQYNNNFYCKYINNQRNKYSFAIFAIVLLNFITIVQSQIPTASWNFSSPRGAIYTNNLYNNGFPPFYLDQNMMNIGANGRYVGNGMYFEGEEVSCTHAPAGTTLKNDDDFTVDIWAYVNILESQSQLVCKFYQQGTRSERFCIGFNNQGQLAVRLNRNSYNAPNLIQSIDLSSCQLAEGWNHITVVFNKTCTGPVYYQFCYTDVNCYIQADSGLVSSGSQTWNSSVNDDPNNQGFLCAGATVSNAFSTYVQDGFTGIINSISFYSGTALTQQQALNLYSTNCQRLCKICQKVGQPPYQCLQQQTKYFQKYEFAVSTYPTSNIHYDTGSRGFNLAVKKDSVVTPSYVQNQGLLFDPSYGNTNQYINSVGSTKIEVEANSFTLEAWVRPTTATTSQMNLYEKEKAPNNNYLKWGFEGDSSMSASLTGITVVYNTAPIDPNEWHYVALSVVSTTVSTSQICFKIDTQPQQCKDVKTVLIEEGTALTQIGDGFVGYIKDMYMYDYAKEELDMTRMVQTANCTPNENGQTCTRCPASTGQCLGTCESTKYVDNSTKQCIDCYASCRTCWGPYNNNCFSCQNNQVMKGTWYFDNVKTCLSQCGDGVRDDFEKCEDGNLVNGDGCSSTCQVETGYRCHGGSFSSKDTCVNICGDGIPPAGGCDDGNRRRGDGCDSECNIETGFTCKGIPSACIPLCGDGLRVGSEQCDDGNLRSGDGCSSICTIESGYNCTGGSEICGDGRDFNRYECDDGNLNNYDGCDSNCRLELGFTCTGGNSTTPDICTETCGDGRNFHTFQNQCDDGNTDDKDGCSSTCRVENGFVCKGGSPYTRDWCEETCGDGRNMGVKECDDGNLIDGDGCHSHCTIEVGYACIGGNSTTKDKCTELCGDGRNFGTHQCDDGNSLNGDGCSSNCTIEPNFICSKGDPYTKSICIKFCDGKRDFYEMCDDGNVITGDGCDSCCNREIGFTCTGGSLSTPDVCQETCGDGRKMNLLECDDGNILNGDGCSDKCKIEPGYTCSGGSLFGPDICKEICGDGRNLGNYQCDDGNQNANDGCSPQCMIEYGFTCTKGNAYLPSKCEEICGDGKKMGTLPDQCDDGNTVSGDGCSSTCQVEIGYECSQGGWHTRDMCYEICGDGLNLGSYQCDDGNKINGDGCSEYCTIEKGFICETISRNQPDFCYQQSNPSIINAYFTQDNKQIILEFNETVYMMQTWSNSDQIWHIEMRGPLGPTNYEFKWDVKKQNKYKNALLKGTQEIIIDFDCRQQLFGNKIDRVIINFLDKNQIKSFEKNTPMINQTIYIFPYGQEDYSIKGQTHGLPQTIDTLTISMVYGSFGISVIGAFFGHSMMDVWLMMNSLQQIYLFPVNNLYIPTATTNYIKNLDFIMPQSQILAYLCFNGITNETNYIESNQPSSYNYHKMGFQSTAFMQTCADTLTLLLYIYILKIIIEVIREAFEDYKSLNNSLERIKSSMMIGYINFAFTKLAFTSHLNLKQINFSNLQNTLSSLLAVFVVLSCWFYMIYIGYQAYKFYREIQILRYQNKQVDSKLNNINNKFINYNNKNNGQQQQNKQLTDEEMRDLTYYRGNVLFYEYLTKSEIYPINLFYPIAMYFKILISVILIISDKTAVQLQGMLLINLINIAFSLLIQPFTSKILNAQLVFNEIAIFILYMEAHQFLPKSIINIHDQQRQTIIMVFIVFTIVSVNAIFVIFTKMTQIVKCRSIARHKPEQIPIIQNNNQQQQQNKKSIFSNNIFGFFNLYGQKSRVGIENPEDNQHINQQIHELKSQIDQICEPGNHMKVSKQNTGFIPAVPIGNFIEEKKQQTLHRHAQSSSKNLLQASITESDINESSYQTDSYQREMEISYTYSLNQSQSFSQKSSHSDNNSSISSNQNSNNNSDQSNNEVEEIKEQSFEEHNKQPINNNVDDSISDSFDKQEIQRKCDLNKVKMRDIIKNQAFDQYYYDENDGNQQSDNEYDDENNSSQNSQLSQTNNSSDMESPKYIQKQRLGK